jgi:hypothetical protein
MLLFNKRSRRHAVLNLIQDCFSISQNDFEICSESHDVCGDVKEMPK